jgi:hypothetical protein
MPVSGTQKASKISGTLGETSRIPAIRLSKIYRLPGSSAVELETYESVRNRE